MNESVSISFATSKDATAIAGVRNLAAEDLTARYGKGHWSLMTTGQDVMSMMNRSKVLIAKDKNQIIGSLRLATKKPWVIDPAYFTMVARPIYLIDMAVKPDYQAKAVGRSMIEKAKSVARDWPGDAIRLDAYDAPAGAGDFYLKCGFVERGRVVFRKVPHIYFEWLL